MSWRSPISQNEIFRSPRSVIQQRFLKLKFDCSLWKRSCSIHDHSVCSWHILWNRCAKISFRFSGIRQTFENAGSASVRWLASSITSLIHSRCGLRSRHSKRFANEECNSSRPAATVAWIAVFTPGKSPCEISSMTQAADAAAALPATASTLSTEFRRAFATFAASLRSRLARASSNAAERFLKLEAFLRSDASRGTILSGSEQPRKAIARNTGSRRRT